MQTADMKIADSFPCILFTFIIYILTKDCILFVIFWVIFMADADANGKSCFSWGASVGKC